MTQARDQVLITPVSVDFLPSIFFKTRGSTYKPFLDDRVIFSKQKLSCWRAKPAQTSKFISRGNGSYLVIIVYKMANKVKL